jgi:hypothetical protein
MMLRRTPRWASAFARPASARLRLRRRLYLFSAPVLVLLLLVAVKLISVSIVSDSAQSDFAAHDIEALADDVSALGVFDVIEPAKTMFATGDLNVLQGRLKDADAQFVAAMERTDNADSCPVRINLELVRETLGDLATRSGDKPGAEGFYNAAIKLIDDAPTNCFAGNDDPNADRRAIRSDALARLQRKLDVLHAPPPPPSPSPSTIPPPGPGGALVPTSGPPLPGLPPSSPPPTPGDQGQAPGQGPGENLPQLPQGNGQGPVLGPDDGSGGDGSGVLDPIGGDRIPAAGNGSAPGHELGPGDPQDRLQILQDNSNAYGTNREAP